MYYVFVPFEFSTETNKFDAVPMKYNFINLFARNRYLQYSKQYEQLCRKNIKISETHKVSEYIYFHFKLIDNYHKILAILMTLLIIIRFPFYSFLRALNFKNFPHSLRNVDYLSSRMTEILRLLPVKNFTGTGVHLNTNPSANNKYSNYSFELSLPCRYQ